MIHQIPDNIHGWTRGKRYSYRSDGSCNECAFEAWERQTFAGVGAGLPRKVLACVHDRVHPPYTPGDGRWVQFVQIAR